MSSSDRLPSNSGPATQVIPSIARNFRSRSVSEPVPQADAPAGPGADGITVIIPAFNEENGIATVIKELHQVGHDEQVALEILVVDDGSTDATATIAWRAGAHVIRHQHRRGYGAALSTGMFEAHGETIVITDADATYPARILPVLISALAEAEMAVALRPGFTLSGNILRSIVKIPLTWLASYIAGIRIPDLNSGMRAFRRNIVLPYLGILPDGFSWTTTITLSLLSDGFRIAYCPASYRKRVGKSKFGVRHAAMFPLLLLRIALLFSPLKVFLPFAALSALYGAAQAATDTARHQGITATAMLPFLCSVLLALVAGVADVNATCIRNISRRCILSSHSAICRGAVHTGSSAQETCAPRQDEA